MPRAKVGRPKKGRNGKARGGRAQAQARDPHVQALEDLMQPNAREWLERHTTHGKTFAQIDAEEREQHARERREIFGAGPLDSHYGVSLSRGGVIAELMVADLECDDGVAHYLSGKSSEAWEQHGPPTVEQLRAARAVCRALEVAIWQGDDRKLWELVEAGREAMGGDTLRRRAVVEVVASVLAQIVRTRLAIARYRMRLPGAGAGVRELERHAKIHFAAELRRARRMLCSHDPAFARLRRKDIEGAAATRQAREIGVAAKLSRACGAFGDAQRDEADVARHYRRARKTK